MLQLFKQRSVISVYFKIRSDVDVFGAIVLPEDIKDDFAVFETHFFEAYACVLHVTSEILDINVMRLA